MDNLLLLLTSGVELFSSGIGDIYYPSNEMDPYIKDKEVSLNSLIYCFLAFIFNFDARISFLSLFRMTILKNLKT